MMWRLLARRCPVRSWTVVGDLAQRGSAAGTSDWASALDVVAGGRWRERQLSVSYRTPGRVLAVADSTARANGLPVTVVQSVREGDDDPVARKRDPGDPSAVVDVVEGLLTSSEEGNIAVVAPRSELAALSSALQAAWPGQVGDASRSALTVRRNTYGTNRRRENQIQRGPSRRRRTGRLRRSARWRLPTTGSSLRVRR